MPESYISIIASVNGASLDFFAVYIIITIVAFLQIVCVCVRPSKKPRLFLMSALLQRLRQINLRVSACNICLRCDVHCRRFVTIFLQVSIGGQHCLH